MTPKGKFNINEEVIWPGGYVLANVNGTPCARSLPISWPPEGEDEGRGEGRRL